MLDKYDPEARILLFLVLFLRIYLQFVAIVDSASIMTNKFSSTFITNFTVDTYMILLGRFNIGSSPSNIADTNPKILPFTIKIAIQITKIYNYC